MPTSKQRINLSVPADVSLALKRLAAKEETTVSSKALSLIERALEQEEDIVLQRVAEKRDRKGARFVSHAAAWQ